MTCRPSGPVCQRAQMQESDILQPVPSGPVPAAPSEILLFRRGLRRSFKAWCDYRMAKSGRVLAQHHVLIAETIERLLKGELPGGKRRVIMLMPPGSAKSTYTSVLLPAWFTNKDQFPTHLMLACSYSYELIEGFGRQARDMVNEERAVLGVGLNKAVSAAGDWRNNRDGGYFCAGVNAGIAGHRYSLGLIDDYLGSEIEADSQLIRNRNWSWFHNDFRPRAWPGAWEIIIANRRHEDDLVGRLIVEEPNEWYIIRLPMLAEEDDFMGRRPGERLWPEWFTDEQVQLARRHPRTWAGLYQQRPAPEEGNYFKREDILTYSASELPKELRIYAGSDWALRKNETNDRTCHLLGGVDSTGRLWILPQWFWKRVDTLEATNKMFEMAKQYRPICWWHGRENITGSIGPFVYQKMRDENNFIPIEEFSESRDKQAKAQSIKARMESKMVMFPKFHPDWELVLNELLTFPAGTHDDFVDALAKLGQGLAKMLPAERPQAVWDGVVPPQRLTCGWVQRSARLRSRRERFATYDD